MGAKNPYRYNSSSIENLLGDMSAHVSSDGLTLRLEGCGVLMWILSDVTKKFDEWARALLHH
jgi:hypothetical protein